MALSPWQHRIRRAHELADQHSFAREILGFYIHLARFQEDLHDHFRTDLLPQAKSGGWERQLTAVELRYLCSAFPPFLSLAREHGPKPLAQVSRELCERGEDFWSSLLREMWMSHSGSDAPALLALAFLQPYAELLRLRISAQPSQNGNAVCPLCNRKPGYGVLRQKGEGAARSLVCSFCIAEWEFRRIVCPACGEEDEKKLATFTAAEFDYIRVDTCDSCKTYLKTIDLTKNGRADPLVDELGLAPLDLWARERGYAKQQNNILGL